MVFLDCIQLMALHLWRSSMTRQGSHESWNLQIQWTGRPRVSSSKRDFEKCTDCTPCLVKLLMALNFYRLDQVWSLGMQTAMDTLFGHTAPTTSALHFLQLSERLRNDDSFHLIPWGLFSFLFNLRSECIRFAKASCRGKHAFPRRIFEEKNVQKIWGLSIMAPKYDFSRSVLKRHHFYEARCSHCLTMGSFGSSQDFTFVAAGIFSWSKYAPSDLWALVYAGWWGCVCTLVSYSSTLVSHNCLVGMVRFSASRIGCDSSALVTPSVSRRSLCSLSREIPGGQTTKHRLSLYVGGSFL